MRFTAALATAVLLLAGWAHPGSATKPFLPGEPRFGVSMSVRGAPRAGEALTVLVLAGSSQHGRSALGKVHIAVPAGIEIVAGDTTRQVHATGLWIGPIDPPWVLVLRATRPGKYVLRGSAVFASPQNPTSWDEMEAELGLEVRPDTVLFDPWSHALRYTKMDHGRRFRYGWEHMVLLEEPDPWFDETAKPRTAPAAIEQPTAVCHGCGLSGPEEVRCVVTVGTDGRVRWIEPRAASAPPEDARVVKAAEDAVRQWRFRPAQIAGRAISDWAEVEVTVVPESR